MQECYRLLNLCVLINYLYVVLLINTLKNKTAKKKKPTHRRLQKKTTEESGLKNIFQKKVV